jgi:hypothetical protein
MVARVGASADRDYAGNWDQPFGTASPCITALVTFRTALLLIAKGWVQW